MELLSLFNLVVCNMKLVTVSLEVGVSPLRRLTYTTHEATELRNRVNGCKSHQHARFSS